MQYKALPINHFQHENFDLIPIRMEDQWDIMQWRNEQIYHLRQSKPLTAEDQDFYFKEVVAKLFDQDQPKQILFSFLENGICIGYGGLVHINWIDQHAEISFVMNTALEKNRFQEIWVAYLGLIEQVAFQELKLHKIFTYAFDIRQHLYPALLTAGFYEEARLKEHCFFQGAYKDVLIHSKSKSSLPIIDLKMASLRSANSNDAQLLYYWVNDISVRANSINQEEIIWENHLKWFDSKLKSPETKIFILEVENFLLGQIRIDLIDDCWHIDYSIDSRFRGKGLGKEIVKLLIQKFNTYKFMATVRKENFASIGVFNKLGFVSLSIENPHFYYFTYENK